MKTMAATSARNNFYSLIDNTCFNHEPVLITGKRGNSVLVSQQDWDSIMETLYLCSIPGMEESILKASKEPLENCVEEIDW